MEKVVVDHIKDQNTASLARAQMAREEPAAAAEGRSLVDDADDDNFPVDSTSPQQPPVSSKDKSKAVNCGPSSASSGSAPKPSTSETPALTKANGDCTSRKPSPPAANSKDPVRNGNKNNSPTSSSDKPERSRKVDTGKEANAMIESGRTSPNDQPAAGHSSATHTSDSVGQPNIKQSKPATTTPVEQVPLKKRARPSSDGPNRQNQNDAAGGNNSANDEPVSKRQNKSDSDGKADGSGESIADSASHMAAVQAGDKQLLFGGKTSKESEANKSKSSNDHANAFASVRGKSTAAERDETDEASP